MLHITKVLTTGAATAGKTCTKHYIFDKPPPKQYTSTDVFDPMYRHYTFYSTDADSCEWKKATLDDTLAMIKNHISSGNQDLEFDEDLGLPDDQLDAQTPTGDNLETRSSSRRSIAIKKLLDPNLKLSGKILELQWIHFVDGGGQSEFLELLPALVSNVCVTLYVIDLTRKPDDLCNDHFTINDRPQRKRQTHLTGKKMFERFFKTICSQKDCDRCKVMFVGTHYDRPEALRNLEKWNGFIMEFFNEHNTEGKVKIIKTRTNDNIHAIDANCREEGDDQQKKTSNDMRKKLTSCCVERKVAIAHFFIEEDLKSSVLAQKHSGILSFSECKEITKQYATENTLKEALQYFHELSEFLFFQRKHSELDGLVFTKPGVLVRIISRLIKVANHCRGDCTYLTKFWKWGIISDADLKEVSDYNLPDEQFDITTYYRPKLFEGNEFLNVLQNLFIAASYADCSAYFIPCVLPPCSNDGDIDKRTCDFMKRNHPLLVTFEGHSIPRGLFCGLVTYLMDKSEWKLRSGNDQNYRTLIEFEIPGKYKLVLVEDFKFMRVHVAQTTPNMLRLKIRDNIATGVKTISKRFYGNEDSNIMNPDASFECSCSYTTVSHVATVTPCGTEIVKPRLVCEESSEDVPFTEDHYIWLRDTEDPQHAGIHILAKSACCM